MRELGFKFGPMKLVRAIGWVNASTGQQFLHSPTLEELQRDTARRAADEAVAAFAKEVFTIAGGDVECVPTPSQSQAIEVVRDLRACYDEALHTGQQ